MVHYSKLDHVLVDHKHRFLYCYVPKVACTNWKRVLMVLTDRSNATDLMQIPASLAHANGTLTKLPDLPNADIQRILYNYTSFLMVRHPFERLLSAYRNKLEDNQASAKYFQVRIGRYIIKKYRQNPTKEELEKGDNVSFREFVRYLIDEKLGGESANEHWKPIYQLCFPCALNYSFIGKYETFEEDSQAVLTMIGAAHVQFPRSRPSQTLNRLKRYFQQLSLTEIESLYRLYEIDFKLFGYDLESILGYDIG